MDAAFETLQHLLTNVFPSVRTIAWDLDGTLGEMPGWDGFNMPNANDYVEPMLPILLNGLRFSTSTAHILISRNGMFCDEMYEPSRAMFIDMGFDDAMPCFRRRLHSKVKPFVRPAEVLLIDDNLNECIAAARDGSYALHIKAPAMQALSTNNYDIYVPISVDSDR